MQHARRRPLPDALPTVLAALVALHAGCRAGVTPPPGEEGGPCYDNGTCDQGLVCASTRQCVDPARYDDCAAPRTLLWATSFEPGEAAPAEISGHGEVVQSDSAHGGDWVFTVYAETSDVGSPVAVEVSGTTLFVSYWLRNDSGQAGDGVVPLVSLDQGSTWDRYGSAAVSTDHMRPDWAPFSTSFELPEAGMQVEMRLSVTQTSFSMSLDDVELFVARPAYCEGS